MIRDLLTIVAGRAHAVPPRVVSDVDALAATIRARLAAAPLPSPQSF
jgi:hypothetical protein